MKNRVSNWRVSIGGVTQCANSTSASSARRRRSRSISDAQRRLAAVDGRAILLEPRVVRRRRRARRTRRRRSGRAARRLPRTARARRPRGTRPPPMVGRSGSCRAACAMPSHHASSPSRSAFVHASAREHVRAAHERRVGVAAHHEDLGTARAVAQDDDRGRRPRVCDDQFGHRRQY